MTISLSVVASVLIWAVLFSLWSWQRSHEELVSLNGNWTIRSQNGVIETTAPVPGSVHMALYRQGIIPDPYFRFNDIDLRWIQRQSWTFHTSFHVASTQKDGKTVHLVCEGIDTVATVQVNGQPVANVSNQFIRHTLDVSHLVKKGENTVTIEIASAVDYAARMYNVTRKEVGYPVPPACPPPEQSPECHANMIRKEQASFGWDWGPAFVTQGIWKDIYLVFFTQCRIQDVTAEPFIESESDPDAPWNLNITTYIQCAGITQEGATVDFSISHVTGSWVKEVTLTSGENVVNHQIRDLPVESWWPRGHGNQTLYDVDVTLTTGKAMSTHSVRTGFRTVKLVQQKMENGLSFHFEVNGKPIFMKGSNWIPADSFQDRITRERIQHLLQSAVDVNMNTIRVWGGGIYEQDYFYTVADELGLMVWQDFMFACAMYPATHGFLDNVRREVQHQLRRLGSHPSIIAWSGNNENEGALVENWYKTTGRLFPDYLRDYEALYKGVVEAQVKSMTEVPFLLSSPTNGKVTEKQGGVSQHPLPSSPNYGDVHYYNYNDDCMNLSIYPRTRYASEYGWQSWPSYHSLVNVSQTGDLSYKSTFFTHREHHQGAGEGTDQLIRRYFHWPTDTHTEQGFKLYLYLTQVVQAMCYRAETEFYRRGRSEPDMTTMGALYWQLNDIWQAPSWSSIQYDGSWKMVHHHAKDFFSDIRLSTYRDGDNIVGYVINDRDEPMHGYVVDLKIYKWDIDEWGLRIYNEPERILPGRSVSKVIEFDLPWLYDYAGLPGAEYGFLLFELWRPRPYSFDTPPVWQTVQYLAPFKDAKDFRDPQLKVISVEQTDNTTFTIALRGANTAHYVWLEAPGIRGRFSENGFVYHTVRYYSHNVAFYSWQDDVTAQRLQQVLTITSVWDVYKQ